MNKHYSVLPAWDTENLVKIRGKETPNKEAIEQAAQVAKLAHEGQTDKAGEDYFTGHLTRVAKAVAEKGAIFEIAALFHDIVEDTDWTIEDLSEDWDARIIVAVDRLTKRSGEIYPDYMDRLAAPYSDGRNELIERVLPRQDLRPFYISSHWRVDPNNDFWFYWGVEAAKAVKKADLEDHLRDTSPISDSLVKRYQKALEVVNG